MAFAMVQTNVGNTSAASTTCAVTVAGTGVGNLVVVSVQMSSQLTTVSSVTDTAGNAYAKAGRQAGSITSSEQWYGVQTTGGATTVTVTVSQSGSNRVTISEFSGGAATNATVFDVATFGVDNVGNTTNSVATLTPSSTSNLIAVTWGWAGTVSAVTPGSGYTLGGTRGGLIADEYRLTNTGSETAPISWTTSNKSHGIAGSYKLAAANVDLNVTVVALGRLAGLASTNILHRVV